MTLEAAAAIRALDRALSIAGEDFILRRPIGNNQAWLPVTCRGKVAGFQPHELLPIAGSGVVLGDSKLVMSPTQIDAAQWPGGYVVGPTTAGDQRVPKPGIDQVIVQGKTRSIAAAAPTYIDGTLVRLDLTIH